jgi:hypothetical protein
MASEPLKMPLMSTPPHPVRTVVHRFPTEAQNGPRSLSSWNPEEGFPSNSRRLPQAAEGTAHPMGRIVNANLCDDFQSQATGKLKLSWGKNMLIRVSHIL